MGTVLVLGSLPGNKSRRCKPALACAPGGDTTQAIILKRRVSGRGRERFSTPVAAQELPGVGGDDEGDDEGDAAKAAAE